MKITFVFPYASVSGGLRVVANYARELVARGHEVTVVSSPKIQASPMRRFLRQLRGTGINRYASEPAPFLKFLGDRHIVLDHNGPVRAQDIPDADVIIATWWETAFAVTALPPEKGRKFYFIQHHEVHDHLPSHISAGSYYLPLKKITISQWLVDIMAQRYNDMDVDLIENSVDMTQFHAPEREKNRVPTVGLLYSTNPFKGVDISLKALEIVHRALPELQVIAYGADDVTVELPLPAGAVYHKRPAQEALSKIYASCDVWLCGSRAEGFHLPPSEAMACRCPVVCTRIGGGVEIITSGVNGYLSEIEDSAALAQGVIKVLSQSPQQWKKMSDAALARMQDYTWGDATDKLLRVLDG